jgi:predicted KAP-like P-loop ATPase
MRKGVPISLLTYLIITIKQLTDIKRETTFEKIETIKVFIKGKS